jgi:serine/threonine protein phosphatase PrpC
VPLSLRTGSCCLQGNYRSDNEDRVGVAEWPDAVVCVVADGMGGPPLGRLVSETAVTTLLANLDKPSRDRAGALEGALRQAFTLANLAALAEQVIPGRGGTTATLLFWSRGADQAHVAHVGDSFAFRITNDAAVPLTTVHDIASALVAAGTISLEDAGRIRWSGPRLYRYLGMQDGAGEVVDLSVAPCLAGDRFVLATDGLTNHVTGDEMAAFLKDWPDAQQCADHLGQLALSRGSRDNVSCVVVNVTPAP